MICLFDGFVYLLFVSGLIVCLVVSYLFVDLFVCCFVLLCWFLICLIRWFGERSRVVVVFRLRSV